MQIQRKDLIEIVEKASTVSERLEPDFLLNQIQNDQAQDGEAAINARLETWCMTVAQGNQERFKERLAWDGLDLNTVRQTLGSVDLVDKKNLPLWAEILQDALVASTAFSKSFKNSSQVDSCVLDSQERLPFEELFLSFVRISQRRLKTQSGSSYFLLSRASHTALERSLLKSLTSLCSRAMGEQFLVFRAFEQPSLTRWIGQLQSAHSREEYNKFINKMLEGELLEFFKEYSMLARLVATTTVFWINNTRELLQRLASDWSEIQATFQSEIALGEVIAIQPGLSDLHNNGRSVMSVTFSSGLQLIYKPKDCGSEAAYFQFLSWLNRQKIFLPFKLVKMLNRSTHGWVEQIKQLPCKDKQAAVRYYQRAGMLISILHALEGTDCHAENIIACEEYPVLIDMETLMAHRVQEADSPDEADADAIRIANRQFAHSVLRTNLLPQWQIGTDGLAHDISGLGGVEGRIATFRSLKWQNINTDGMVLGYESFKTCPKANTASLEGVNLSPSDYVEELVDGFRQMYQFLLTNKAALLASGGPLETLANQRVRFIFRPTQVYSSLLTEVLQPKFLRHGVDFSIALDVISKSLLSFKAKPRCWSIIAAEKKALTQLDIPFFATSSNSDSLILSSNTKIKQYFTQSSYSLVIERLKKLSEDDLQQQIGFIRSSLYTCTKRESDSLIQPGGKLSEEPPVQLPELGQKEYVHKAAEIAYELQNRAVQATDGSVTWMGLEYIPASQRFQHQPMGYDLYDGSCGIALFLAALQKVTGDVEFGSLAVRALQPFQKVLEKSHFEEQLQATEFIGIGGGKGLGSIIYTFVRMSQFLGDPALLESAQKVAALIIPKRIEADQTFDILSGTAGTALGLLTLYAATADRVVLEQAVSCGRHLLNHRSDSGTVHKSWKTVNGRLLTGLSHGAAGIAYALLRLYEVTHHLDFKDAACDAIAYERSVFSPATQNWPDFRSEGVTFGASWCHGAPGIGLARLGSLKILDTKEIREDIETALQTTQKLSLQDIDHLCCGNFGRIEVLLSAASQLGNQELMKMAHRQAAWIADRAGNAGSFQMFPTAFKDLYNPGFYQGTAGAGYALLRLAHPKQLPSVLLWQ